MPDVLADIAAAGIAAADIDTVIDWLYALDTTSFTEARNAVAKALRAAKRRDDAAVVAKLARPTAAAAALNHLARSHPKLIDALRQAGELLRDVQGAVVRGETDARALTQASDARRATVRSIVKELAGSGADARRDECIRTLEAASVDDELGDALAKGRLARTVVGGVGFEGRLGATEPSPPRLRLVGPDERAAPSTAPSTAKSADNPRTDDLERRRAYEERRRAVAEKEQAAKERADQERAAKEQRIADAEAVVAAALIGHRDAVEQDRTAAHVLTAANDATDSAATAVQLAQETLALARAQQEVAEQGASLAGRHLDEATAALHAAQQSLDQARHHPPLTATEPLDG